MTGDPMRPTYERGKVTDPRQKVTMGSTVTWGDTQSNRSNTEHTEINYA